MLALAPDQAPFWAADDCYPIAETNAPPANPALSLYGTLETAEPGKSPPTAPLSPHSLPKQ